MRYFKICFGLATKLFCIILSAPIAGVIIVCNWIMQLIDKWYTNADLLITEGFLEGDQDQWGD